MGVFVNTVAKTLPVSVIATHWLYKNGSRIPRGWFPFFASKWSYNIAIRGRGVRMAPDAAVGKP